MCASLFLRKSGSRRSFECRWECGKTVVCNSSPHGPTICPGCGRQGGGGELSPHPRRLLFYPCLASLLLSGENNVLLRFLLGCQGSPNCAHFFHPPTGTPRRAISPSEGSPRPRGARAREVIKLLQSPNRPFLEAISPPFSVSIG